VTRPDEAERESVPDDVSTTLREGRMILPGVQTLFGFQLAVVFTDTFQKTTSFFDQAVHIASLCVVAMTIATLILPAAYHRRVMPGVVSRRFTCFATRCLKLSLAFMTVGMGLNFYLVTDIVFHRTPWSIVAAALASAFFVAMWFGLPSWAAAHRTPREEAAVREGASSPAE
jgi:predicted lysophospholipase L1 biosynthesis ABC-type transport system permease subunit